MGGLQKLILLAQVNGGRWAGAQRETGIAAASSETATGSGHGVPIWAAWLMRD